MTTTLKDAADDDAFITALKTLNEFATIDGSNATEAGVNAMLGKLTGANLVAKVDGSNATEAGVNAMLGKLTGDNVVVKVPDLTAKVNVTGDNAIEAGINAMLGKLTGDNRVVKADATNADNIIQQLAAPTPDAVANLLTRNSAFINAIKANVDAQNVGFQDAVREVISQPSFEIPQDESAPISIDF